MDLFYMFFMIFILLKQENTKDESLWCFCIVFIIYSEPIISFIA